MGYSVSTVCKSAQDRRHLMKVLRKHWRPVGKLYPKGTVGSGYISNPKTGPTYAHQKLQVGFDGNASGAERFYAFTACKWIALRIGERKRMLTYERYTEPKPTLLWFVRPKSFISYDSDGEWPVLTRLSDRIDRCDENGEWGHLRGKQLDWCLVDHWGVKKVVDLHDVDDFSLMQKALAAMKKRKPYKDPDWRDALNRSVQPELLKHVEPIRQEIKRLDKLLRTTP